VSSAARMIKFCLCLGLAVATVAWAQTPAPPQQAPTEQPSQNGSLGSSETQSSAPQSSASPPQSAAASPQAHQKWNSPITAAAIWKPDATFIENVHKACDADPKHFDSCFIDEMKKSGASPEAVAFTERSDFQGILQELRQAGPPDIAYALYLFRANENQVVFLVNGFPPMFDVDDPGYFPKAGLEQNAEYQRIKQKYPNVMMFPGNRGPADGPQVLPTRGGGERFLVHYWLMDQCHACAHVGSVTVAFGFDFQGKFLNARVISVSPVPVEGEKP